MRRHRTASNPKGTWVDEMMMMDTFIFSYITRTSYYTCMSLLVTARDSSSQWFFLDVSIYIYRLYRIHDRAIAPSIY